MFRVWTERSIPAAIQPMFEGVTPLGPGSATPEDPLSALVDAQGVIAGGTTRYDAAFMDRAPGLKVIARTGIGIDNVDVPEATSRGVAVCNTPDGPTISTAEHTITLMMNVAKQVKRYDRALRESEDRDLVSVYQGSELNGLHLGLVGLGRIGSRVATIARALGMSVTAYDPFVDTDRIKALGVEPAISFEAILEKSDVISLHIPLIDDTRRLMNADRFGLMKKGAIFLNIARGGLVDEKALLSSLESGHLGGAGIDVFDPEPPPPDHPLLHRDDVIATPHIGGITIAGRVRMWKMAVTEVLRVLRGERPVHVANPEVLPPEI